MKIYKCKTCGEKISGQGKTGLCSSCVKINPNAKYKQKYYCRCGKEICYNTIHYGLGMCHSCAKTGKNHPLYGKHQTQEHKDKRSKALKGKHHKKESIEKMKKSAKKRWQDPKERKKTSGKNSVHYIHGEGNFPYPPKFTKSLKKEIKERDNYKCQCCGMSQEEHFNKWKKDIEVHHIDHCTFNCDKTNLITLCKECNNNANYNRDYYYSFYNYIMENYIYV
jgi:hypothetical protein